MYNEVLLAGAAGAAPCMRRSTGQPYATLSLATRRSGRDRQGQRQEDAQWHPLVFWCSQAERAAQILDRGRLVIVEGRLKHSSWSDPREPAITHHRTQVVVEWFRALLSKASAPEADDPPEEAGEVES